MTSLLEDLRGEHEKVLARLREENNDLRRQVRAVQWSGVQGRGGNDR